MRWTFPRLDLRAGEHLVVFASGKDRRVPSMAPAQLPDADPGFKLEDVPGLLWWLDASDAATFDLLDGKVDVWRDKVGRTFVGSGGPVRYDAKAGTPEQRPVWVSDPLTGLPAVRFDGERQLLRFPQLLNIRTAFWVVRELKEASDSFRPLLGSSNSAEFGRDYDRILFVQSNSTWLDGVAVNPLTTRLPTRRVLVSAISPAPAAADSIAQTQGLTDVRWMGDMMEILLFDRALSDAERVQVERYLQRKWLLPSTHLHSDFQITPGQAVFLSDPAGGLIDTAPPVAQDGEMSRGRVVGAELWQWFATPTPGAANLTLAYGGGVTPPLVFDPPPGPFTNEVTVRFDTNGVPGAEVFYSTDGNEPTNRYVVPLTLTGTTAIRAQMRVAGRVSGEVQTGTYFLKPAGGLPILSIVTPPANLWDEETGIYVAGIPDTEFYPNYERDWERAASVEFFEPDGSRGFATQCGIKIHGNFTRRLPQKSIRLQFRSRYGDGRLNYAMFPGNPVSQFDSLLIRNFGNDWNLALMRDVVGQAMAAELRLDHQDWRHTIVYLNGAYHGVYAIRERSDGEQIAAHYGGSRDDYDVIRNSSDIIAGDRVAINETFAALSELVPTDEASFASFASRIDLANFADWLALELYLDNTDWPQNNISMWRRRETGAVWRWSVIDCDSTFNGWGFGVDTNSVDRVFRALPVAEAAAYPLSFIRQLTANPTYRNTFLNRFADLLNTRFSPAVVRGHIDRVHGILAPAMPDHVARWGKEGEGVQRMDSVDQWESNVDVLRDFAARRPPFVRDHLAAQFSLAGVADLTVDVQPPEAANILRVNSVEVPGGSAPWTGSYFQGVPVTVSVEPKPGRRFVGWRGRSETNLTLTINPQAGLRLTAVFETDLSEVGHHLAGGPYRFGDWSEDNAAGTYPARILFQQTAVKDPTLEVEMDGVWTNRYNLGSRSRVVGLGPDGFAFLNTSDPADGGGFLGAAVLSVNTRDSFGIRVAWTGGTVAPNRRPYAVRLQWRLGETGAFADLVNGAGQPVEYVRSETAGEARRFDPFLLPAAANDQPLVQLRWKYYALPTTESGSRAELRVDDIEVTADRIGAVVEPPILTIAPGPNAYRLASTVAPGMSATLMVSTDLAVWEEEGRATANAAGLVEFDLPRPASTRQFFLLRLP